MRTLFPLYLIFTAALWAFVSQEMALGTSDSATVAVAGDGTPIPTVAVAGDGTPIPPAR